MLGAMLLLIAISIYLLLWQRSRPRLEAKSEAVPKGAAVTTLPPSGGCSFCGASESKEVCYLHASEKFARPGGYRTTIHTLKWIDLACPCCASCLKKALVLKWLRLILLFALFGIPALTLWLGPDFWDRVLPWTPVGTRVDWSIVIILAAILLGVSYVLGRLVFNARVLSLLGQDLNRKLLLEVGAGDWGFVFRGVRISTTPREGAQY
jgi:hypothetical protein